MENTEKLLTHEEYINEAVHSHVQYSINVNSKNQYFINSPDLLSNKICTSKYNYINAIPKIVCEQFSKVGNIYFLFLAILQMIPSISQSGGTPIMLIPLTFVVLVNGIKDFCEDYKRKQSDSRENKTKCIVIDPASETCAEVDWEEIKPGDVVKVNKDEYFPADLVLFYSTHKNGVAYVETKNMDGETNLKYKESVKNTYRHLKQFEKEEDREAAVRKTGGMITCDHPNAQMYEFEGIFYPDNRYSSLKNFRTTLENEFKQHFTFEKGPSSLEDADKLNSNNTIILDYNNLLLRGSSLRNTDFVYGVVVYCGHNSKIMMNSLNARTKQSRVFKIMNEQLKVIILFQALISFIFALLYSLDPNPYDGIFFDYTTNMREVLANFIFAFLAWVITICNIVPISLILTLEMIKFSQAIFISWDFKMYDKENKRTAIVQSSGLNEELGQVHHIFTDKTGTLTKNLMQFRYVVIGDFLYGSDKRANKAELNEKNITNVDFNDETLFEHWNNINHINSKNISVFIFSLALCHSIIVERKNEKAFYNASSPDELALVNAAKYFGVEFTERTDDNYMTINYQGESFSYKLLHIFEFNSDRKRMSVVIKDNDNVIRLICKGADSVITKRIDAFKSYTTEKRVMHYLEEFGKKGLRTLMIADREISESEYKAFLKNYYEAYTSSNSTKKKEKLAKCYDLLERDMTLLGATAIEDCLQDELRPTLEAFRQIGIKVWMLTGDHPFTAVSIGHSCGLIEKEHQVVIISSPKYEDINKKLIEVIDEECKAKMCLVITGDVLAIIQKPSGLGLKNLFLMAIEKAKCVICSRVSPKQKAELILMVKAQDPNKTTLAIGDGANDVNMINSADVGIGIMGNEGQQAARASDYVIGQFSFLRRLLFVHGREAYRKNSFAVGYILWKNFLYATPCIFLGFTSNFSGQTLYDPFLDTLYNILFTAYPIGWFATYDKELNYDKLESSPDLYEMGMNNELFNIYIIWRWYIYAASAGFIIYWNNSNAFSSAIHSDKSEVLDLWAIGSSMYTCIVCVVNLKIMFATNTHNSFSVFLLIFSLSAYFVTLWIASNIPSMTTTGQWKYMGGSVYIATLVLIITACLLCEYGWRSIHLIIEEYFIKATKVAQVEKKRSESVIEKLDDSTLLEKGFSVRINNSSINYTIKDNVIEEQEEDMFENIPVQLPKSTPSDIDQIIVLDKNKKYTGFAFAEDVANVNIINQRIKENFFDSKFSKEQK